MPCGRDRRFGCFSGFLLPVGELLGRDAFKQRLYERACSVALGVVTLGHEARFGRVNDVVALDVGQREAVTLLREVSAKPYLEGAYAVENHALRVLQMNAHLARKLGENGQNVGISDGGRVRNLGGKLLGAHLVENDRAAVPLAEIGCSAHLVLYNTITNTHCVFLLMVKKLD